MLLAWASSLSAIHCSLSLMRARSQLTQSEVSSGVYLQNLLVHKRKTIPHPEKLQGEGRKKTKELL